MFPDSGAHFARQPPNSLRYLLVGRRGPDLLYGKLLKHRKLLENAQTPTSRVHAVLGHFLGPLILLAITENYAYICAGFWRARDFGPLMTITATAASISTSKVKPKIVWDPAAAGLTGRKTYAVLKAA